MISFTPVNWSSSEAINTIRGLIIPRKKNLVITLLRWRETGNYFISPPEGNRKLLYFSTGGKPETTLFLHQRETGNYFISPSEGNLKLLYFSVGGKPETTLFLHRKETGN